MQEPLINDVVNRLGLQKTRNNKIRCPFHKDKDPSMVIYSDTNRFYCFGCGATGNVWELIKKVKGVDFNGAVEWSNSGYSKSKVKTLKPKNNRTKLISADTKSVEVYNYLYDLLGISDKAIDYLKSRGLSSAIIGNGEISSVENPAKVYKQLQEKFTLKELKHSGLVSRSQSGNDYFTFYKPGIVFFFIDEDIYYIQSRNYDNKSKTTNLGRLSKPLFNLEVMRRSEDVWLCEGVIDALSLIDVGLPGVALLGTTLNKHYTNYFIDKNVILMLDFDEIGQSKTGKLVKQLEPVARTIKKIDSSRLQGSDPNEIISNLKGENNGKNKKEIRK